jgi:hypothetical protein
MSRLERASWSSIASRGRCCERASEPLLQVTQAGGVIPCRWLQVQQLAGEPGPPDNGAGPPCTLGVRFLILRSFFCYVNLSFHVFIRLGKY